MVKILNEKRLSILQRNVASLLACLLIAVVGSGLYAIRCRNAAARASLVGTWKGEPGNVVNMRLDGTARSRSRFTGEEIGQFDWTFDAGELAVYEYGSISRLSIWYHRVLRFTVGAPSRERYQVVGLTPEELKLLSASGEVLTFDATQDIELETAP